MNDFQTGLQIIVESIAAGGLILIAKLIVIVLVGFWPILFLVAIIKDWKKNKTKHSDLGDYSKGFRDAVIRMKEKGQLKKK